MRLFDDAPQLVGSGFPDLTRAVGEWCVDLAPGASRDGTAIINDSAYLADYRGLFDELARLASFGDDARDVLRRIAEDYRGLLE
jgi:hypothetical protein